MVAETLAHKNARVVSRECRGDLSRCGSAGLVEREVEPGPPVAVTYRLTQRGQGLGPAMDVLRVWAGAPVDEDGHPVPYADVAHELEAR
ncbi:winged helix-turn-helix transcriptional regulator [Streptomyces sp. bgisy084]|uniref:winged helix-turn-helix transcriptional regulator n=1 Tax=Streptomyces sp. bgisy084 TaxID=3413777 RepID=UPI003D7399A9